MESFSFPEMVGESPWAHGTFFLPKNDSSFLGIELLKLFF